MCRTGRAPSSWCRVVCPTTDDSTDAFYRLNIKIENNTPAHRALHEERSPLSPRTVSSKQGGGGGAYYRKKNHHKHHQQSKLLHGVTVQELKEMTQAQLAADMEAGFTEESSDLSVHSSGTHGSLFWGDQHHSTALMEQLSTSSLDDGISVLDSCCSSSNPPFDESPTKCSSKRQQHCPRWTNKSGCLQTMMINVSP